VEQNDDRRTRVKSVLERRGLSTNVSKEEASQSWIDERFVARARALFYARMMFLTLGLLILTVPVWYAYFNFSPLSYAVYFLMLLYSVANYLVLDTKTAGRPITYITLCIDLIVMVVVVVKPETGGGLQNPLLASQLLFTTLFAILFPRPLAILPPLLALPVTARLDQLLDRTPTAIDILTLIWFLGLNFIIIYVMVYLNERELTAHREVVGLQSDLKDLAIVEERNRLSREIHDGLGASLSSLIIQSEYVSQLVKDEAVVKEVAELKSTAEEAIEELRRSLHMMREDFDLGSGVEDYVKTFALRVQLPVHVEKSGTPTGKPSPEAALALFRVLQECLSNAAKHAQAKTLLVKIYFAPESVVLTVKDDGKGFDSRVPKMGHYGLINMRERAIKVGGDVTFETSPGNGCSVQFTVPLEK
jgi:two-component system, NarL family, sensor histidine kinase DegS